MQQKRFIKFGTLHPLYSGYEDEIRRLHDAGVRGIKLQPDVQQFTPDDPNTLYPLYESLCRYQMTVMFHVGGEPLPSPDNRSRPAMIARIARDFPELKIIAAHLGGLNMWDEVEAVLVGVPNVWMETSLSYRFIKPDQAQRIVAKHGHEKIFFGTDYPFAPIDASLAAARSVTFLTNIQKQDILGRNAHRFFFDSA
ncbi:MAG: amidohydrolase family protein [Desulfobacterota bacterium]|nr:amidohydrolase family protein [Thermodesulfobacteriota bacterium]